MRPITDGTGVGDYPTLIRVLGQCASVDKEADTFVVDANPYTHVLEGNGWLSVEASFSSQRFATMTKKPFPNPSNTVLVEGFAGNVAWTDAQKLERIRVDVERIAFPNKAKTVSARAPGMCISAMSDWVHVHICSQLSHPNHPQPRVFDSAWAASAHWPHLTIQPVQLAVAHPLRARRQVRHRPRPSRRRSRTQRRQGVLEQVL
jgi:hypothetical protein